MKQKQVKVYERYILVEGTGDFPLDMLRYDCGFPSSGEDAAVAADTGRRRRVGVTIRSLTASIAPARWASFGWLVVHDGVERGGALDALRALESTW